MKRVRRVTEPNLIALGNLVSLLLDNHTLDNRALAEQTGLTYLTVNRYTAAIYQAGGAYISGWKRDGRGAETIRIYCLGGRVDVKPKVLTHAEKMRELRKKWKKERTATGMRVSHGE